MTSTGVNYTKDVKDTNDDKDDYGTTSVPTAARSFSDPRNALYL
jgi:hypothetical protein